MVRGLVGSLLVLLGGWAVAALPASLAFPGFLAAPLSAVRTDRSARPVALAVVVAGLALLAVAWAELLHRTHLTSDLNLVTRCTTAWAAPLLVAPPLFSLDGWAYAAQGALAAAGLSPYEHGPAALGGRLTEPDAQPIVDAVDPRWLSTPSPYGPLPIAYGGALARLTSDPLLLVLGHRLAALAGLALLGWAVPRLARRTGAFPAPATALVIASPLALGVGLGGLHNDLLMVGFAAAGVAVARERWLAAAALVGLAAAVKVPALLVLPGLAVLSLPSGAVLGRRLRRLASVGAVAVGVLLGLGLVTGLGVGWVHALGVPGSVLTQLSPLRLVEGPARDLVRVLPVVAAAAVVVGPRSARTPRTTVAWIGLALVAAALLGSAVRVWYLLWAAPFLAVVPLPTAARRLLVGGVAVVGVLAPFTAEPGAAPAAYAVVPVSLAAVGLAVVASRRVRDRVLVVRPLVRPVAERAGGPSDR